MVCVCVLRAYGEGHADGARVGDARQTRRSHARPCTHKRVIQSRRPKRRHSASSVAPKRQRAVCVCGGGGGRTLLHTDGRSYITLSPRFTSEISHCLHTYKPHFAVIKIWKPTGTHSGSQVSIVRCSRNRGLGSDVRRHCPLVRPVNNRARTRHEYSLQPPTSRTQSTSPEPRTRSRVLNILLGTTSRDVHGRPTSSSLPSCAGSVDRVTQRRHRIDGTRLAR